MAYLTEEAQWIVMLGFIISVGIFFLAIIVNESTLVGKTTSESVLEFPKIYIQDFRSEILEYRERGVIDNPQLKIDLMTLSLDRKSAVIYYDNITGANGTSNILLHYNDGITEYTEIFSGL